MPICGIYMRSVLEKLKTLYLYDEKTLWPSSYPVKFSPLGPLTVYCRKVPSEVVGEVLRCCKIFHPVLYMYYRPPTTLTSIDLCYFVNLGIRQLVIDGYITRNVNATVTFKSSLRGHFNLSDLFLDSCEVDDSLLQALSTQNYSSCFSNLRLIGSKHSFKGKLSELITQEWPRLTGLSLIGCQLDRTDESHLKKCLTEHGLLPNLSSLELDLGNEGDNQFSESDGASCNRHIDFTLCTVFGCDIPNVNTLELYNVRKKAYKFIAEALNKGYVPQMTNLNIIMLDTDRSLTTVTVAELPTVHISTLTSLTLQGFIDTAEHLIILTQSPVLTQLHKLDISNSPALVGNLSALLSFSFPEAAQSHT